MTAVAGTTRTDTDAVFDRPPLAQTFTDQSGSRFTVVVNHFKSKGCADATGADLDQGDGQSCYNARRTAQATRLVSFIGSTVVPAAGDPDVLVIGDLNAYAKEDPITVLANAGYVDLVQRTEGPSAYSFVFDGLWGSLDYALANASLARPGDGGPGLPRERRRAIGARLQHQLQVRQSAGIAVRARRVPVVGPRPILLGIAPAAVLSIAGTTIVEGNAGVTQAVLTVTRTGGAVPVSVAFATADDNTTGDKATPGADYTAVSGTLSFEATETSKQIAVDVLGDTQDEPNESFAVILSAPTNGAVISTATATVAITDDDEAPPAPRVDAISVSKRECLCIVTVPIRLSTPVTTPVSVRWRTVGGTARDGRDFVGTNGAAQIPAGSVETSARVLLLEDLLHEGDEAFRVEIVSVTGGVVVGDPAIVTVVDDDPRPRVSVRSATVREADRNVAIVLVMTMSGFSATPVTVQWSTQDGSALAGSDYVARSASVTFAPGELVKLVTVTIAGDRIAEPTEDFGIATTVTAGPADPGPVAFVTIRDDDGRS